MACKSLLAVLLMAATPLMAVGPASTPWATLADEGGQVLLSATNMKSERVEDLLGPFGLSSAVQATPSVPQVFNKGKVRNMILETPASRSVVQAAIDPSDWDTWFRTETTEILGLSLSATIERGPQKTVLIRDNFGGGRTEAWRSDLGLLFARDEHGMIVSVEYDTSNRPYRVVLGGSYALEVDFADDTSRLWNHKRLIDLASGKVIGSWQPASPQGKPGLHQRSRARLMAPGYAYVAEWDEELYPEGRAIGTLRGEPYLIVPFDGGSDIRRSLSLRSLRWAHSDDRLDYNGKDIRLSITLGGAPPLFEHSILIDVPRRR